jgi:hypothetical protein
MAWRILSNKKNTKITLNVTGNSANIIVVGNSTVSNIALPTENVASASIRRIQWGTDTLIKVFRGANLVITVTQTGEMFFEQAMGLDSTANIDVQTTSANSWMLLEVYKNVANNDVGLVT